MASNLMIKLHTTPEGDLFALEDGDISLTPLGELLIGQVNSKSEALLFSAKKWLFIAEMAENHTINNDGGMDTCACCARYVRIIAHGKWSCRLCPIAQHVNAEGCNNTPYEDVGFPYITSLGAADEYRFLVGLLKEQNDAL
jgi:hypothetical protein